MGCQGGRRRSARDEEAHGACARRGGTEHGLGRRRIHQKPNAREIAACRPWLDAEIAVAKPAVLVCLGATAAQALLGRTFRVSRRRGEWAPSPLAPRVMATVHPSSVLRAPDDEARRDAMARLVADLKKVARVLS